MSLSSKIKSFSFYTVSFYCCGYATLKYLECLLQSDNNSVIKIPSLLILAGYQLYTRVQGESRLFRTHGAPLDLYIHINSVVISCYLFSHYALL